MLESIYKIFHKGIPIYIFFPKMWETSEQRYKAKLHGGGNALFLSRTILI